MWSCVVLLACVCVCGYSITVSHMCDAIPGREGGRKGGREGNRSILPSSAVLQGEERGRGWERERERGRGRRWREGERERGEERGERRRERMSDGSVCSVSRGDVNKRQLNKEGRS